MGSQMRTSNCWTQCTSNRHEKACKTFNSKVKCTPTFQKMLQSTDVSRIVFLIQQKKNATSGKVIERETEKRKYVHRIQQSQNTLLKYLNQRHEADLL